MTRKEAARLAEIANKLESQMLNDMGPDEYKSYMAMPLDHRFKIISAALAAAMSNP